MSPSSNVLSTVEHSYDAVPRAVTTADGCGPFTVFVPTERTTWSFSASPRLGLDAEVTPGGARRLLERQAGFGVVHDLDWVDEALSYRPLVRLRGRRHRLHPGACR